MLKKILLVIIISLCLAPVVALAVDPFEQVKQIGEKVDSLPQSAVTSSATPQEIIVKVVRYFLTFVGIFMTISVLYAGFQWMTSGGEAEKIDKAKSRLKYSVLGLLIVLSAYAIVIFVYRTITVPYRSYRPTTCETDEECQRRFGPNWYCLKNDNALGSCLLNASIDPDTMLDGADSWWKRKLGF